MKNRAFLEDIKCCLYKAIFKKPLKEWLKIFSLLYDSIEYLRTAGWLQLLIKKVSENKNEKYYIADGV